MLAHAAGTAKSTYLKATVGGVLAASEAAEDQGGGRAVQGERQICHCPPGFQPWQLEQLERVLWASCPTPAHQKPQ